MDEERKRLLRDFLRAAYLHPEGIKSYLGVFSITSKAVGKKLKERNDLEWAKVTVLTPEFLDKIDFDLEGMSNKDLQLLIMMYSSPTIQQFRKCLQTNELVKKLNQALFEEFTQDVT